MKRFFAAVIVMVVTWAACGGTQKKESPLVNEGSDAPATCCCKTIPPVSDKEITPNYAMVGRMECSSQRGECVDDVQCNASKGGGSATP